MVPKNLIDLAAERRVMLGDIVLDHPAKTEAHEAFHYVMSHADLSAEKGKLCVPLIGPSQSGKSTIIESFARTLNTSELIDRQKIPVLHVTLEANVTRKGLAQNILEALGEYGRDTGSERGSETVLLQRVRKYLREAEVKLLVLDEFHHLVHSESQKLAYSVGESIKRMLIKGVCPIVLSGVSDGEDEGARLPLKNKQLQHRAVPTIELRRLSTGNPSDLEVFKRFFAGYLKEMERRGVVGNATSLTRGDIPACIFEVTDGVLGASCNLIKEAVRIMTYDGRDDIVRADLALAADLAFVRTRLWHRNPFAEGSSPIRAAAA
jgi:Bacterial TniB protein